MDNCKKCSGDRFELLGCCSGLECGCRGMPVQMTPCDECNSDGKLAPGSGISEWADYLEVIPKGEQA